MICYVQISCTKSVKGEDFYYKNLYARYDGAVFVATFLILQKERVGL
jgi:hypothetical protein